MALGLIEALGLSTAMVALDAATKAADVTLTKHEKVIGAGKMISVTLHLVGEVAAVQAAVEAGHVAGSRVGTILSTHVIPRPDEQLGQIAITGKVPDGAPQARSTTGSNTKPKTTAGSKKSNTKNQAQSKQEG